MKKNPVENVAFNNDPVYELYGNIDSIDIIRVQKTEYNEHALKTRFGYYSLCYICRENEIRSKRS